VATSCVTSSMFLTALAPNVLAQSLVEKTAKVTLGWNQWFLSFLPVGIILFLITPLLTYVLYPPTQKISKDAPIWAVAELAKMGPFTRREIIMALLAVAALAGWIFLKDQINATTVALAAISVRLKNIIQLVLREPALLQDQVIDRAAGLEGFLGNCGGLLVAQDRVKGGDYPNAILHHVLIAVLVSLDPGNATLGQYAARLARGHQAQIIADLGDCNSRPLHGSRHLNITGAIR
jgi:hypothetical protein